MKGVILAGGFGTRLRPLTLTLPKPVVPIVDRPLLLHQLDLLASAGVRELVFSVAYRPERVQAIFGDGTALGRRIHYAVEETPLGTGGAVKNAEPCLDDLTIVLNGDVLTDVDLAQVVRSHKASGAKATIVLTPVANPAAFGLVETDQEGRVLRFLEKPRPEEITTNTINAGIYVLDTKTLGIIPKNEVHSIERGFFPALLARGDLVRGHLHSGYWIDIGTPAQYLSAHRDILRGRFRVQLGAPEVGGGFLDPSANVHEGAILRPPFFVGPACEVAPGASIGPDTVLVSSVEVGRGARIEDSVLWAGTIVGEDAEISGALLGTGVRVGPQAKVAPGAVLGEGTVLSAHSATKGPSAA